MSSDDEKDCQDNAPESTCAYITTALQTCTLHKIDDMDVRNASIDPDPLKYRP